LIRAKDIRRAIGRALVTAFLATGCGGARAPSSPAGAASAAASSAAKTGSPEAPKVRTRFTRREIIDTLSRGLGAFLARVQVEPAISQGRFHGWRILALQGTSDEWGGVDLKPGDVVTDINGRSIERPEQALASWQSLAVARELRVGRERKGERGELVYPIDD
jgi:type II secretory pathway component PulC